MAGKNSSKKVVLFALGANLLIAIAKFVAWYFTKSSAMIAEAIHSVADTGNQGLMLLGLKRAERPPDRTHPYGYGKETYFWSFVVALSLFTLGATFSAVEGTHKLGEIRHSEGSAELEHPMWAIAVLLVSLVVEGGSLWIAVREFRKGMGARTVTQTLRELRAAPLLTVLFEDFAAVLGLGIALVGIGLAWATGNFVYDAIASLMIAVLLAAVAVFLGVMTKRLLIGQSASEAVEAQITAAIEETGAIESIIELKTLHMGGEYILLNLALKFPAGLTTVSLEKSIDRIESAVRAAVPEVRKIFVEVESFRGTAGKPGPDAT